MKKKYQFRSNLVTFIKGFGIIILISLHRSVSMNTKIIAFIAYSYRNIIYKQLYYKLKVGL